MPTTGFKEKINKLNMGAGSGMCRGGNHRPPFLLWKTKISTFCGSKLASPMTFSINMPPEHR